MKKIALVAALVALSACNEDPFAPNRVDSGSVRFNFPGAAGQPATVFDASGSAELTRSGNFQMGDWAYSERGPQAPQPIILHSSMRAEPKYHYLTMQIPRDAQSGDVLRGDPQCSATAIDCARIGFLFNTLANGGATTACVMTSGEVRITSASSSRMRGTFDMTASCTPAPTGPPELATITGGTFDVEIIDYDDYASR